MRVIPEIGNGRNIGGGVIEARDVVLVRDANPIFARDLAAFGSVEEVAHYGFVVEGFLVIVEGFDFHEARAAVAERMVVIVAMRFLDNDFVLIPAISVGMFRMASLLPRVTQAAVPTVRAPAAPEVTSRLHT